MACFRNTNAFEKLKCTCCEHTVDDGCPKHSTDEQKLNNTANYRNPMRCPFDILSKQTIGSTTNRIKINYGKSVKGMAVDTGHVVEFDLTDSSNSKSHISTVQMCDRSTGRHTTYVLKQFHIHNPSEYTVDGKHKPMELHFVNEYVDDNSNSHILVIGMLVGFGKKDMQILPKVLNSVGDELVLDLSKFNCLNENSHYHYVGSLTSPPYTPYFQWFLFDVDDMKNMCLSVTDATYRKSLSFYETNITPHNPLGERRYGEPLNRNFIALTRIVPEKSCPEL